MGLGVGVGSLAISRHSSRSHLRVGDGVYRSEKTRRANAMMKLMNKNGVLRVMSFMLPIGDMGPRQDWEDRSCMVRTESALAGTKSSRGTDRAFLKLDNVYPRDFRCETGHRVMG